MWLYIDSITATTRNFHTQYSSADDYCGAFDLTQRIPRPFLDQAMKSSQLVLLNASRDPRKLIDVITESLGTSSQDAVPIRICIPLLGSPGWGDLQPKVWMTFSGARLCCNVTAIQRMSCILRTLCARFCGDILMPALR